MGGRSIISIDDLSIDDIESVFETADQIRSGSLEYSGKGSEKIAATLFYEPSTRTRLSFEAATQRLGGGVISTWDVNASSVIKGESLADTVRVIGSYADVLIVRHIWEGAAKLASEYSPVPVINAGDGSHEHPTQTLCDLYTLRSHHGSLRGLKVAICGDLQHGRTTHSLAFALARFGANVIFVPGDGNQIPSYVLRRLEQEYHAQIQRESLGFLSALFDNRQTSSESGTVDAIYVTPGEPHQLAMTSLEGTAREFRVRNDEALAIYITRKQKERSADKSGRALGYPTLRADTLKDSRFKNISILHPLPRVDELSPDVDEDPRSLYFQQAALGIPIRMALLWHVLGLGEGKDGPPKKPDISRNDGLKYTDNSFECENETCITNKERQFAKVKYEIVKDTDYRLRCLHCDHETLAKLAGNADTHYYYSSKLLDRFLPPVRPENVRFFKSSSHARASGFRRASEKWDKYQNKEAGPRKSWLTLVSGLSQ